MVPKVNPSAMESRYRDRPESNSRQNFARLTGTQVNSRVPEKNAQQGLKSGGLKKKYNIYSNIEYQLYINVDTNSVKYSCAKIFLIFLLY